MPLICYEPKNFVSRSVTIIDQANTILEQYASEGFDLTLRQLYYQFIARDLFPDEWADKKTKSKNTEASYKKLGSIINDARLAGLIDWDHINDRTRNLASNSHWDSPASIIEACSSQFLIDKWANQANYVEVWVEKDALVGILEHACTPLDVPYFSCRGYTSQSEMWSAAMRLVKKQKAGKKLHIIHLGDHDPSGIDMTRDIKTRLNQFIRHHTGRGVTVDRIALTMDQVREYEPPPNPAKSTDSRFADYADAYGDESWELDALEPRVLTDLIQDAVKDLMDTEQWEIDEATEKEHRASLEACAERWPDVVELVRPEMDNGEDDDDDE